VILEVRLICSELTIIRRSALVEQLRDTLNLFIFHLFFEKSLIPTFLIIIERTSGPNLAAKLKTKLLLLLNPLELSIL